MSGKASHDFDALISRYLDGDIQEEDFIRLQSWLKKDRVNVEYFVDRIVDHCRTAELVHGYFLPFLSIESEQIFQDKSNAATEDSGGTGLCVTYTLRDIAKAVRTLIEFLALVQLVTEGSYVIGKLVKQHAKALAIAAAVAIAAVVSLIFILDQDTGPQRLWTLRRRRFPHLIRESTGAGHDA